MYHIFISITFNFLLQVTVLNRDPFLLLCHPFLYNFIISVVALDLQIYTSVIDPTHTISKPQLISTNNYFHS